MHVHHRFDMGANGGAGGAGGSGGDASATGGAKGSRGINDSKQGMATTFGGDAGHGGDGTGPGTGGIGGVATTSGDPIVENQGDDGLDGEPCPGPETVAVYIGIDAVPLTLGVIAAGSYQVPVRLVSDGTQIATTTVTYPTGGYLGTNPDRTGLDPQAEVVMQVGGIDVGGQTGSMAEALFCFVNSPGASPTNPVTIEALDASMNVVSTQTWPTAVGVSGQEGAGAPAGAQMSNCRGVMAGPGSGVMYARVRGIQGGFIDIVFALIVWTLVVGAIP